MPRVMLALVIAALALTGLPVSTAQQSASADLKAAAGLHELFLHDDCTGDYAPQPDTCLHKQLVEKPVTFGGKAGTTYDVRLRVRGTFEPTTIAAGETPHPRK